MFSMCISCVYYSICFSQVIGRSCDANSGKSMDHALDNVVAPCGNLFKNTWTVTPSDSDYCI